jgi:hypothetical protein
MSLQPNDWTAELDGPAIPVAPEDLARVAAARAAHERGEPPRDVRPEPT